MQRWAFCENRRRDTVREESVLKESPPSEVDASALAINLTKTYMLCIERFAFDDEIPCPW